MVHRILAGMPTASRQVSILLTDDAEMRTMNRRYRGLDRPTDVLSFPAGDAVGGDTGHLGDIAVSVETAARQARTAGWRTQAEIQFLILHGLLHLLGFDHETDAGEMERLQALWARRLWGRNFPSSHGGPARRRRPARRAGASRLGGRR
jgi:probable rRNA maturation factor